MKRKKMENKSEYIDFVKSHNNKTNVYTTVYDFEEFSEKMPIESSVIIDRIFLDFDAHEDELPMAWRDVKVMMSYVTLNDWQHTLFFSGRGFHLFIFGEVAETMRDVQTFFRQIKEVLDSEVGENTLDERVGQTSRLRRVPNTVNMSSSDGRGNARYCIPLTVDDLDLSVEDILSLAKKPRNIPFKKGGTKLVSFPKAPPIEAMEGEVSVPDSVGSIPMLPCLHNAVMVENPTHTARAYLVSWYRDLLSGYADLQTIEEKNKVLDLVVDELERVFADSETVWLDWDKHETRKHSKFTVFNNYNTPHCDTLITNGFCVGKCWRYNK